MKSFISHKIVWKDNLNSSNFYFLNDQSNQYHTHSFCRGLHPKWCSSKLTKITFMLFIEALVPKW